MSPLSLYTANVFKIVLDNDALLSLKYVLNNKLITKYIPHFRDSSIGALYQCMISLILNTSCQGRLTCH